MTMIVGCVMCDRSKVEILAREFAIMSYDPKYTNFRNMGEYVDNLWSNWEDKAIEILAELDRHE